MSRVSTEQVNKSLYLDPVNPSNVKGPIYLDNIIPGAPAYLDGVHPMYLDDVESNGTLQYSALRLARSDNSNFRAPDGTEYNSVVALELLPPKPGSIVAAVIPWLSDASSTKFRNAAQNRDFDLLKSLIDEKVLKYICDNELYGLTPEAISTLTTFTRALLKCFLDSSSNNEEKLWDCT
eukprot:Pgem_evm1s9020